MSWDAIEPPLYSRGGGGMIYSLTAHTLLDSGGWEHLEPFRRRACSLCPFKLFENTQSIFFILQKTYHLCCCAQVGFQGNF